MILLSAYRAPAGYRVDLASHIFQMQRQPSLARYRELAEAVQWVADVRYGRRIWVEPALVDGWIVRHFDLTRTFHGFGWSRRRPEPLEAWHTTSGVLDPAIT